MSVSHSKPNAGLRIFSKFLAIMTFFLIFAGSMVTSTGSGLAVPDWPLSYGMLFPPMVGGVFYEHGHRLLAATVGFFTVVMVLWIRARETRLWVKRLSALALLTVILQGMLGGITVLFYLPLLVSTAHAILGQTFFLITLFLAYSYSNEFFRTESQSANHVSHFTKWAWGFLALVYVQLLLGALMRHAEAGLAVPDFPTMAGYWWPSLSSAAIQNINAERFMMGLDPVSTLQVGLHLAHRLGAIFVLAGGVFLTRQACYLLPKKSLAQRTAYWIMAALCVQIMLGVTVILTVKQPLITSFHVWLGAGILGLSALLLMRTRQTSL